MGMGPARFEIGNKVAFKDGDGGIYRVTKIGSEEVDGQMEWTYCLRSEPHGLGNFGFQWQLFRIEACQGWDQEKI
jgi:hypothetical protein